VSVLPVAPTAVTLSPTPSAPEAVPDASLEQQVQPAADADSTGWQPYQNRGGDAVNWIALGMSAGGLVPPRGALLGREAGGLARRNVGAGALRPVRPGRARNPGHIDGGDNELESLLGGAGAAAYADDEQAPVEGHLDTGADSGDSAEMERSLWQPLPEPAASTNVHADEVLHLFDRMQHGELCWVNNLRLAMRCAQMHPGTDIFVQAFMLVDEDGNVLPMMGRRARLRAGEGGKVQARADDNMQQAAQATPQAAADTLLQELQSAPLLGLSLREVVGESGEAVSALQARARTDLQSLRRLFERALPAGLHDALTSAHERIHGAWQGLMAREDFEQRVAHHGDAIQRVLDQGDLLLSTTLSSGDVHAYRAQANWRRARAQVQDWAERGKAPDFDALLTLNRLLGDGLAPWNRPEQAARAGAAFGVLRHFDVVCGVPPHFFLGADELLQAMLELFEWYRTQAEIASPLLLAAQMHQRLLTLHPFADANGRTARLVLEWLLRRAGLPPAALRAADIALFVYEREDSNPAAGVAERQLMEALDKSLALHREWLRLDDDGAA
jgi:hypothetical protein